MNIVADVLARLLAAREATVIVMGHAQRWRRTSADRCARARAHKGKPMPQSNDRADTKELFASSTFGRNLLKSLELVSNFGRTAVL